MKKKREFKVGQIVAVTWIDSGCRYTRAGVDPEDCDVSTIIDYGRVVHVSKKRIVLTTHEHEDLDRQPHNEVYEVIWQPSIQSWKVLR